MKLSPRKFIFGLLFAVLCGLAIYAFAIEPDCLVVNDYSLKIKKWSPKLNGFKIVAISDIHAGSNFINKEKLNEIVVRANSQDADLIVLLGDYLSRQYLNPSQLKMPVENVAENLSGLRARYGVYAVLGNHDNEYDHKVVRAELEKIGIKVLENELVSINKEDEILRILGVNDILKLGGGWSEASQDLKKVLGESFEKGGTLIVLTHNPDTIVYLTEERLISEDLALILAGHTHGGQCRFPLIGSPIVPSTFGQKYVKGHIQDKGLDMFVTTGIGTSILPVRFGVPPEISVLKIYAD
jgi:uncharacterized protein